MPEKKATVKISRKEWIIFCLLILLTIAVLLPHSPAFVPIPNRDSGLFLYTGWRVLQGDIPYHAVWDHKPPLIFFFNAIGLLISPNTLWGVWLFQCLMLILAAGLGFLAIRKTYSIWQAAWCSVFWLFNLVLVLTRGGNQTEQYALTFQFLAIFLFLSKTENPRKLTDVLIGAAMGGAFFLRQNLIGLWIAIVLYLFVHSIIQSEVTRGLKRIILMFSGWSIVAGIFILYFALNRSLIDFWDAAFRYNFVYTSGSLWSRPAAIRYGLAALAPGGGVLLIAGWIYSLFMAVHQFRKERLVHPVPGMIALAVPVEMFLSSLSTWEAPHYFIAWLPVLSLCAAALCDFMLSGSTESLTPSLSSFDFRVKHVWLVGLLVGFCILPVDELQNQYARRGAGANLEVVEYIESETVPGDTVLFWGAESAYNFLSRRAAPTRFVYQYPLMTQNYATAGMVEEFTGDLMNNPPVFIVDTSPSTKGLVPSLALERYDSFESGSGNVTYHLLPEMQDFLTFVSTQYVQIGTVGVFDWPVYRYEPGPR
jgi:hypothetical protein